MNKVNTFGTGTRQFAVGVVAAMSLCLAAHAAHAEEAAPQRVVAYADLNIHTPDGAATLYRRIKNAAVQVCGSTNTVDLTMAAAAKTCQDQAIRAAVITVHSPLVTREYLAAHHQKSDTISVASLP